MAWNNGLGEPKAAVSRPGSSRAPAAGKRQHSEEPIVWARGRCPCASTRALLAPRSELLPVTPRAQAHPRRSPFTLAFAERPSSLNHTGGPGRPPSPCCPPCLPLQRPVRCGPGSLVAWGSTKFILQTRAAFSCEEASRWTLVTPCLNVQAEKPLS